MTDSTFAGMERLSDRQWFDFRQSGMIVSGCKAGMTSFTYQAFL